MGAQTDSGRRADARFRLYNAGLSILALGFLAWLLLLRRGSDGDVDLRFVPALNAGLNAAAACLLCAGFAAIRRGRRGLHKYAMVGALACSTLFLVGYVAYHYAHGDARYEGPARAVYLAILATHVLASMALVPLVLATVFRAARGTFDRHRRIARVTLPVWLYVSITGVVIYFMLHA